MFRVMQRTANQSLYCLLPFRNINSTRFYIVLRRFKKQVLVTYIRKIAKVRLLGRAKMVQITNFCLIDVLFYSRLYLGLRALARRSPWPTSSSNYRSKPSSSPTIRRWLPSSTASLRSSSRRMRWSIMSATMK